MTTARDNEHHLYNDPRFIPNGHMSNFLAGRAGYAYYKFDKELNLYSTGDTNIRRPRAHFSVSTRITKRNLNYEEVWDLRIGDDHDNHQVQGIALSGQNIIVTGRFTTGRFTRNQKDGAFAISLSLNGEINWSNYDFSSGLARSPLITRDGRPTCFHRRVRLRDCSSRSSGDPIQKILNIDHRHKRNRYPHYRDHRTSTFRDNRGC